MTNQRGVTLLEVLLSITLLSIVIVTFLSFFTNAFRFNAINDDHIQAMNIAREQRTIVREKTATQILTEFTQDPNRPDYLIKTFPAPDNADYVITISIKKTADTIKPKTAGGYIQPYQRFRQVHIQVTTQEDKLLSETYTYYEGNLVFP